MTETRNSRRSSRLLVAARVPAAVLAMWLLAVAPAMARTSGCPAPSGSYAGAVLGTPGLSSYWRLGEAAGATVACDSKANDNGSYQGPVTLGIPGALYGDPDTAASFDGTSSWVSIPSNFNLNPAAAVSVEAWINPTGVSTTRTIVRKNLQYSLRVAGAAIVMRVWAADGTYTDVTSPKILIANAWQQIAATYDGQTVDVYRNGRLLVSQPLTGALPHTNNALLLASSRGGSDYFSGGVDEVALYTTAIGANDIASHYNDGAPDPVPDPPAGLDAATGNSSVTLSWQPVAATDLAGYRVYRQNPDGSWPTSPVGSTDAATTAFQDTGLSNATTYTYRVTAYDEQGAESPVSPMASADPIAPVGASTGDPVIAAASDIACDPTDPNYNGGAGENGDCAEGAVGSLLATQPLDAILPLGDLQYNNGTYTAFEQAFNSTWGRLRPIIRPIPGNHEYLTPGAADYFDYFNGVGAPAGPAGDRSQGYYSYNLGAWHLIALNSNCAEIGGCGAGSAQEQWLQADLAAHPARCILAYWHWARWVSGWPGDDTDMSAIWQDLYNVGADVALNGHDRYYERFQPLDGAGNPAANGIREFIAGTGGRATWTPSSVRAGSQVLNGTTHGVLTLTLHPTSYDWKFIPTAGSTFTDSGSQTCS